MRATAVILDVAHRCLVIDGALPGIETTEPLRALVEAAPTAFGVALAGPVGMAADGATFLFVIEGGDPRFVPLRQWATDPRLAAAWPLYVDVMLGGWQPPTRELDVFCFGNTPALAALLAHQVAKGVKRGSSGSIAAAQHEGATIPVPGMVSIVTDGFGFPVCAIRTVRVDHVRFGDAGEEIARAEGEGDRSFADWHATHLRYFTAEAASFGATFDDDSPIVCEYFELLSVLGS